MDGDGKTETKRRQRKTKTERQERMTDEELEETLYCFSVAFNSLSVLTRIRRFFFRLSVSVFPLPSFRFRLSVSVPSVFPRRLI
jgi:hypothetical protein